MFAHIARFVVTHPWRVVAGWLIAVVATILLSPSLESHTNGNQQTFLPGSFESVQAQDIANESFPGSSGASGSLVVTRDDGATLSSDDQQTVTALAAALQSDAIPGVTGVNSSPQSLSQDGKAMALQVTFAGQPGDDAVNDAVPEVRSAAGQHLEGTGLTSGLTGNAAILVDTNSAYDGAEKVITIATILVIVVLLGLVFRSPVVAILPVIIISLVYRAAQGLTAVAAALFDFEVSTSLDAILVVVLFGVGTDYVVFLLFRYREELRRGTETMTGLITSASVVGKVIASSALTVIGAFAALFLAKLGSLTTLAPGLIIGVAAMLITALTLIPALFAILGDHLFWPLGPGREPEQSTFGAVGSLVARRPAAVATLVIVALAALAVFATGYKATYNTLEELPSDTPSQQTFNTMAQSFPSGALSPTQILVKAPGPVPQDQLSAMISAVGAVEGVASVGQPRISQDGTAAMVNVVLGDDPYSTAALDLVEGPVRDAAHASVTDAEVFVGGQTSMLVDVRAQLDSDTEHVFPLAFLIVAVILGLLLLSIPAPVGLLVCVALTFAATLGVLVLVFLTGAGLDGIDFSTPIVLYLFVVAIGTDYNILIAARLREEFKNGYSPRDAAKIAIANDAPTVVAAGTVLALTFASLALTGLNNLQELGVGVAVGVLLASLVMAPILVPALSIVLGKYFWWPSKPGTPEADNADGLDQAKEPTPA